MHLKDDIEDKESEIRSLSKDLALFEGEGLDVLDTDELKSVSLKARKTMHKANHLLLQRMEQETDQLRKANQCTLCTAKIDTLVLPCGHVCSSPSLH